MIMSLVMILGDCFEIDIYIKYIEIKPISNITNYRNEDL